MDGKKKVLFVHHDGGLSGAPISLSYLLDCIDTTKIEAKLLCIFKGPVLNLFKSKHVELLVDERIYPFHGSTVSSMTWKQIVINFVRLPQSIYYAYKFVKKMNPDVVHLNSSCLFVLALASKWANKNTKVICHVREPLLKYSFNATIMRYMNYHFVDEFIAIDRFSAASMKAKSPIEIIYNSVDFRQFNAGIRSDIIRKQLGLKEEDVLFLYLARISKSNGAMELLDMAEKLTARYKNFHIAIAGFREKEAEKRYAEKVRHRIDKLRNVHPLDFTSNVVELIANADVMLVPFTEPHFARSIIEASAMGVPTVGSAVGGVDELIRHGETGFLYTSPDRFYEYCVQLGVDKTLRETMGRKAEKFALENFDHQTNAKKVFRYYE